MDRGFISRHDLVPTAVLYRLCRRQTLLSMPFSEQRFRQRLYIFENGIFKSPLICAFININSKRFKFFQDAFASCVHFFQSHVNHRLILFNSCYSWRSGSRTIGEVFRFILTMELLGYGFMITVHNLCSFIRAEVWTIFVLSEKDNLVMFAEKKRHYA